MCVQLLSRVWFFATPWTVPCQAPLSVGFSRQEYWRGLPFPSPGDLPDPAIEPHLLYWQADSLPLSHNGALIRLYMYLISIWNLCWQSKKPRKKSSEGPPPTTQQPAGHWGLAEAEEGPPTGTNTPPPPKVERERAPRLGNHFPINARLHNHTQKWSWRKGRQQHASLFSLKSLLTHLEALEQTPPHLAPAPYGHVSEPMGPVCHIPATIWRHTQATSAGTEITQGIWEPCQFSGGVQGSLSSMWGHSTWVSRVRSAWLQLPEVNHPSLGWCVFPFRGRITNKKRDQWLEPLTHFLLQWFSTCGAGDSRDSQSQNHFLNTKMLFDCFYPHTFRSTQWSFPEAIWHVILQQTVQKQDIRTLAATY